LEESPECDHKWLKHVGREVCNKCCIWWY